MGPWSPDWRPDPTGRRIAAIRSARRGALAGATIFGAVTVVAGILAPEIAVADGTWRATAIAIVTLGSLPGLALLGAALTANALDSRLTAVVTAVAIGIGAPVAAVASAMIGVFVAVGLARGLGVGADVAGETLQAGVHAAMRVALLIAAASAVWVLAVRRWARWPAR